MCLVFLQRNNQRFTKADSCSSSVGKLAQKPENVNRPDKNRIFLPRDFFSNGLFQIADNSRIWAVADEFGTMFRQTPVRRSAFRAHKMLLTSTQ